MPCYNRLSYFTTGREAGIVPKPPSYVKRNLPPIFDKSMTYQQVGRVTLSNLHCEHRNRSAIDALDREAHSVVGLTRGKHVEQRQVMIGRGN
jgi:hypothetical protein